MSKARVSLTHADSLPLAHPTLRWPGFQYFSARLGHRPKTPGRCQSGFTSRRNSFLWRPQSGRGGGAKQDQKIASSVRDPKWYLWGAKIFSWHLCQKNLAWNCLALIAWKITKLNIWMRGVIDRYRDTEMYSQILSPESIKTKLHSSSHYLFQIHQTFISNAPKRSKMAYPDI